MQREPPLGQKIIQTGHFLGHRLPIPGLNRGKERNDRGFDLNFHDVLKVIVTKF